MLVLWQGNGNGCNHAQFKSRDVRLFTTHTDIRRVSKRFTDVQSAMTVMLPTWRMDQRTIKISKVIPVACWQLVQLFAPVSPALHMCLEWIILACARHILPFPAVMSSSSSSSIVAGDQAALLGGPQKKLGCLCMWLGDSWADKSSVTGASWWRLTGMYKQCLLPPRIRERVLGWDSWLLLAPRLLASWVWLACTPSTSNQWTSPPALWTSLSEANSPWSWLDWSSRPYPCVPFPGSESSASQGFTWLHISVKCAQVRHSDHSGLRRLFLATLTSSLTYFPSCDVVLGWLWVLSVSG